MKSQYKLAVSVMALALVACASEPAIGRSDAGHGVASHAEVAPPGGAASHAQPAPRPIVANVTGVMPAPGATMTKERQAKVTPAAALKALQSGNERFLSGKLARRDLREQVKVTGHGQFPFASVVSCIDSRASPEVVFDQGVGDIFSARVAGNFVNKDILGSLEYASKVAGSRLILVLGHTHCGAVKGVCDNVKMGSLTGLLDKLRPALNAIPDDGTPRNSTNHEFVDRVAEMNVRMTVRQIQDESPILRALVSEGKLLVVGAMLDVETGRVEFLEEAGHDKMAARDSLHH